MTELVDVSRIRDLNDQLRRSLTGGMLVMTKGIIALGAKRQMTILSAIAAFDSFKPADDPYGEHDFGFFKAAGHEFFWKIDLYEDPNVKDGNGEPAVMRVLTIMLAEEY